MTQQIEAMNLALEALKKCHYYMIDAGLPNQSLLNEAFTAYKALEEALAQPEQEPVAWADLNALSEQINSVNCGTVYRLPSKEENRQPLYTTPPQRKPLTLNWAPIQEFWRNNSNIDWDELESAITEAAHDIKENT